ncbi:arginine--tRNA ligase [Mycoplasma sp. NEAQ87857]|uniref:arginine--tRNA ligase n=1 Tax=Mycoplasma sp. NEAQ87857 TaxID=2683967 RepID=UPI001316CE7A|nr:arginine--tRNA ligase [Mycoplasma sp. NEAQ87857]QGZ97928.1 arginine--tRNA ligase [Mycoplasma sp. NEAQ87857]
MGLKQLIKKAIIDAIIKLQNDNYFDVEFDANQVKFNLSEPNVPEKLNIENNFYAYSSNVAFVLKAYKKAAPTQIASEITNLLNQNQYIQKIDIAMPGFLNIVLNNEAFTKVIENILKNQETFGEMDEELTKERINIEFVSANPTGFLHVGHVRGAVYGDSLARIYKHAGFNIEKEYYINDAGNQINILADSTLVRYQNLFGIDTKLPEDSYGGMDIVWLANQIKDQYGDKFLDLAFKEELKELAVKILLEKIKSDLARINVTFDTYSSEKFIKEQGMIEPVLDKLKNDTYVDESGALFLKTEAKGDDKDRVLVKSDQTYTYLLPDVAYHETKYAKADKLINIWGADHSGYIKRMKVAMEYLGHDPEKLDILTIQLVRLIKDGQEFKMSKRLGTSVTLEDLLEMSSSDVIRFTMLTREINNKFDFDIDLANSQDNNSSVFIVQYAYSRTVSLLAKLANNELKVIDFSDKAKKLIIQLDNFQELISTIVQTSKVNLLSQYLIDLARDFNSFYSETKLIGHQDETVYASVVETTKIILGLGLSLIGVSAPSKM